MRAKSTAAMPDVRRALNAACRKMLRGLRALRKPGRKIANEVHALRKLGKSVRGGLVLLGVPGEDVRAVAAVGRLLGGARDAVSRRTTWRRLGFDADAQAGDPSGMAIDALVGKQAKSAMRRPPAEVVAWAELRVREAMEALREVPDDEVAVRLERGRKRLEKRLRKKLKRLERDPGPEEFHGARKALKAWLGALAHLNETPPSATVTLADLLGDLNDLHTLGEWLHAQGFSPELAPEPWRALRERRGELEKAVLAEAATVRDLPE